MTWWRWVVVSVVLAVLVVLAALAVWGLVGNVRRFVRLRRLLPLEHLTDTQIQSGTSHSKGSYGRFPEPGTPRGLGELTSAVRARAYARLARRRARAIALSSEAALLIGGAALGTALFSDSAWEFYPWLAVALIGLWLRTTQVSRWERIAEVYERLALTLP